VERDLLQIHVNGSLVSTLRSLTEFAGYVAFQSNKGNGIEFQNLQVRMLPSAKEPFGQGAYPIKEVGGAPEVLRRTKPFYPMEPHRAGIQGTVRLEAVIEADGTIGDVRVAKPLHSDLDEAAIACVRQWRFKPGTSSGSPVPVIATMEISFELTNR
jgi:TonB family protein